MKKVENGSFVRVEYTGTLDNGDVFYSSEGRQPLEVQVGSGKVIPGFEAALLGMAVNETKTITLCPEAAYGPRDDNRMQTFPVSDAPPGKEPEVGQSLMLTTRQGEKITARVASIDDDNITFDLNHPLAGKDLTFTITVVGISPIPTLQAVGGGMDCASGGCGVDCSGCGPGPGVSGHC